MRPHSPCSRHAGLELVVVVEEEEVEAEVGVEIEVLVEGVWLSWEVGRKGVFLHIQTTSSERHWSQQRQHPCHNHNTNKYTEKHAHTNTHTTR